MRYGEWPAVDDAPSRRLFRCREKGLELCRRVCAWQRWSSKVTTKFGSSRVCLVPGVRREASGRVVVVQIELGQARSEQSLLSSRERATAVNPGWSLDETNRVK